MYWFDYLSSHVSGNDERELEWGRNVSDIEGLCRCGYEI